MKTMGVRAVLGAVVLSVGMTAGCAEVNDAVGGVNEAVDGVQSATAKASVCAEALEIINLNPDVNPEQVAAQAGEKAQQLRELGNQVADQTVQETLFDMADGYVALEQRQAEHLADFSQWLQENLADLERLRQACL